MGCVNYLADQLGPRYSPQRARLSKYQIYHDGQRPILARLLEIVPTIPEFVGAGRGLIFLGTVGTGKDHLMASMLYLAANAGAKCSWVNGLDWFGSFRDAMDSGKAEESIIRPLSSFDVLGISDPIPPCGAPTAFNIQQLVRLLDRRNRAMKSTWITVNAMTADDAEEKLSVPVFDRLSEGADIFRCFWPSFRGRN